MKPWIDNPKLKGSGIIECIPQKERCPNNCEDCFFQSGRSYLGPLSENLPHIPTVKQTQGKIVRMNDGNDSNNQRELVEAVAQQFESYFFNTAIPHRLEEFSAPVVLTVNPGQMTDIAYHMLDPIPNNLMFVRIRTNAQNINTVVHSAVEYYTIKKVPMILTFMAYYTMDIDKDYLDYYEWKQRTTNSYYCLKQSKIDSIMNLFKDNPYVYQCGYKGTYNCTFCGNCIREYYRCKNKERS